MNVTYRPLPAWPYPETLDRRSRWAFKAGWSSTLELLTREIEMIRGDGLVLAAGFAETDIRLDGMPRSNARTPRFPGIELSFTTPEHGRLVYATDVCEWWEHNVRSIALGLEALRAVDRYGITQRGQQYAGFKELTGEVGEPDCQVFSSPEDARHWLAETFTELPSELVDAGAVDDRWLVREAAKKAHPDHGGDAQLSRDAMSAKDALGL